MDSQRRNCGSESDPAASLPPRHECAAPSGWQHTTSHCCQSLYPCLGQAASTMPWHWHLTTPNTTSTTSNGLLADPLCGSKSDPAASLSLPPRHECAVPSGWQHSPFLCCQSLYTCLGQAASTLACHQKTQNTPSIPTYRLSVPRLWLNIRPSRLTAAQT